jgi:hypothetical protein
MSHATAISGCREGIKERAYSDSGPVVGAILTVSYVAVDH